MGRGQPVRASERTSAPRPEARTGCRKADAGRSQTVAERQAAPRPPVPKWGAKTPGARAVRRGKPGRDEWSEAVGAAGAGDASSGAGRPGFPRVE